MSVNRLCLVRHGAHEFSWGVDLLVFGMGMGMLPKNRSIVSEASEARWQETRWARLTTLPAAHRICTTPILNLNPFDIFSHLHFLPISRPWGVKFIKGQFHK